MSHHHLSQNTTLIVREVFSLYMKCLIFFFDINLCYWLVLEAFRTRGEYSSIKFAKNLSKVCVF